METAVLLINVFVVSVLCAKEPIKNVFGYCSLPLGMEEGKIPDNAISASSSYETKSVGPQNARIRQEKNGGAWCPKAQISSDIREYLEIDLTQNHLITWTETQGRFGNGQGQEYAEQFFLEYWRDEKWHHYKNLKGSRVLRGNSNTYLEVKQKLELPFLASRVRFVPYSLHPRTVCMRVEIYGCVWDKRILKYSAPKGDVLGICNLEDASYDGVELNGVMLDGLGQLVDGVLGDAPENEIITGLSSNWVGWSDRQSIELVFEFSEEMTFENCLIHVAHLPDMNIEVFSDAKIWFSADGKLYQSNLEQTEIPKEMNESSAIVEIPLNQNSGKFVKIDLKPAKKWVLISEVAFETVSGTENISLEKPSDSYKLSENETKLSKETDKSDKSNKTLYKLNVNLTPDAFPISNSQTYIGVVSGVLTVVVLFLTCIIFLMKQRGRNKVALLQKHTALFCTSSTPGITINAKDAEKAPQIVVNSLFQSRLSLKSKGCSGDEQTIRDNDNISTNEYEQCSAYERTYKVFSEESLAYEPPTYAADHFASCKNKFTDNTFCELSAPYVEECVNENYQEDKHYSSHYSMKRLENNKASISSQQIHEGYYAATDILTIKRREQFASIFTSLRIEDCVQLPSNAELHQVQHISRHRLRTLDKLGEGSFGLVHLCEAKGMKCPDTNTTHNRQVVIVRSLWRGVTDSLRRDFMRNMYLLATIKDINIARLIALIEEEPFGAVFEYGELGDLPTFLKTYNENNENISLCYNTSLNVATQIASGMMYLESLNIPHCDLAARNCIVTKNYVVKVSDHAIYCSKYDQEYYINGDYAKVPLRWMSWEAMLLGKQSCHADVWSYAVTLWEVYNGCREIPYSDLTSEQVLENYSKWYHGGTGEKCQPRILPQPHVCSKKLYHMMTKCWNKHIEERPTFEKMYHFLKDFD